ncbi:MAG: TIGR03905 family TSCPD domain-containing protein [Clostridiales bacterium]|nr:TIGR03905 family TSCPD domain-containing protein [Clostridiales bacterium]
MHFTYATEGTCSTKIDFEINDGKISDIVFTSGCNGNLKAISKLVDGWEADEIAAKLSGNTCGFRSTSCADQLAKAVLAAKEKEAAGAN